MQYPLVILDLYPFTPYHYSFHCTLSAAHPFTFRCFFRLSAAYLFTFRCSLLFFSCISVHFPPLLLFFRFSFYLSAAPRIFPLPHLSFRCSSCLSSPPFVFRCFLCVSAALTLHFTCLLNLLVFCPCLTGSTSLLHLILQFIGLWILICYLYLDSLFINHQPTKTNSNPTTWATRTPAAVVSLRRLLVLRPPSRRYQPKARRRVLWTTSSLIV